MKIANLDGRLALVLDDAVADVETASDGRFGPDPMGAFAEWEAFTSWADGVRDATGPLDMSRLRCPVPAPRQVFAIGLNSGNSAVSGLLPGEPMISAGNGQTITLDMVQRELDWRRETARMLHGIN